MNWDFSSLTDVGWIIGIVISIFGIFITIRNKPPLIVINIWKRSKEPESGMLWVIGGFVVGLVVGQKINEWKEKEE